MATSNTAGLEEQLGCSGLTLFALAFAATSITLLSKLLFPRISASKS